MCQNVNYWFLLHYQKIISVPHTIVKRLCFAKCEAYYCRHFCNFSYYIRMLFFFFLSYWFLLLRFEIKLFFSLEKKKKNLVNNLDGFSQVHFDWRVITNYAFINEFCQMRGSLFYHIFLSKKIDIDIIYIYTLPSSSFYFW